MIKHLEVIGDDTDYWTQDVYEYCYHNASDNANANNLDKHLKYIITIEKNKPAKKYLMEGEQPYQTFKPRVYIIYTHSDAFIKISAKDLNERIDQALTLADEAQNKRYSIVNHNVQTDVTLVSSLSNGDFRTDGVDYRTRGGSSQLTDMLACQVHAAQYDITCKRFHQNDEAFVTVAEFFINEKVLVRQCMGRPAFALTVRDNANIVGYYKGVLFVTRSYDAPKIVEMIKNVMDALHPSTLIFSLSEYEINGFCKSKNLMGTVEDHRKLFAMERKHYHRSRVIVPLFENVMKNHAVDVMRLIVAGKIAQECVQPWIAPASRPVTLLL